MGVTEQTYWQPLVKVMRHRWCCYESRTDSTDRVSGNNVFTSVVMPVICWYTGFQPPSFLYYGKTFGSFFVSRYKLVGIYFCD